VIKRNVPSLIVACSTLAPSTPSAYASALREATLRTRGQRWAGSAPPEVGSGPTRWPPAAAERFFTDEVATLHHTVLLARARVRLRRVRLGEVETTLRSAQGALGELIDGGPVPELADEVETELDPARGRASSGELLEPPSEAELAVLRLLAGDLSTREIGERRFVSQDTIRSHKRATYHKLGLHYRTDAVARATALGLLGQTQSPG
jgi:DNA-binding CsgD family transcriptional regulator